MKSTAIGPGYPERGEVDPARGHLAAVERQGPSRPRRSPGGVSPSSDKAPVRGAMAPPSPAFSSRSWIAHPRPNGFNPGRSPRRGATAANDLRATAPTVQPAVRRGSGLEVSTGSCSNGDQHVARVMHRKGRGEGGDVGGPLIAAPRVRGRSAVPSLAAHGVPSTSPKSLPCPSVTVARHHLAHGAAGGLGNDALARLRTVADAKKRRGATHARACRLTMVRIGARQLHLKKPQKKSEVETP